MLFRIVVDNSIARKESDGDDSLYGCEAEVRQVRQLSDGSGESIKNRPEDSVLILGVRYGWQTIY